MSGIGIDRDAGRALFCKEKNKRNIRTAGISCRLCRHRQDPVPAGKDPYGRRMVLEEGKEDLSVSVKAKDQKKRKLVLPGHKEKREIQSIYAEAEKENILYHGE